MEYSHETPTSESETTETKKKNPEVLSRITASGFKKRLEEKRAEEASIEQAESEAADGDDAPITDADISRYHAEKRVQDREDARRRAKNIAGLNLSFIAARGKRTISQKEFEIWESDYADEWRMMRKDIVSAGATSMADEALLEEPAFFSETSGTLHETIEAQSGQFFRERARALSDAIRSSDMSEKEKEQRLNQITEFYNTVMRHLYYKSMSQEEQRDYGYDYYNTARTNAHNKAVAILNGLNDMARSFGLKPFTPRNFWTSENKSQTPAMQKRMRYDRYVVQEYYAIAFEDEAREAAKKQQDVAGGFNSASSW